MLGLTHENKQNLKQKAFNFQPLRTSQDLAQHLLDRQFSVVRTHPIPPQGSTSRSFDHIENPLHISQV